MKSLPLSLAAGALALGLAASAQAAMIVPHPGVSSVVEKAGCYDECEYYLEALQEAREEAREAAAEAAEYAAEEAEEYGYRPRRASRRQAHTVQRAKKPAVKAASSKSVEEQPLETSGKKKDVAVNTGTCRQYSPATGMLLSVACE